MPSSSTRPSHSLISLRPSKSQYSSPKSSPASHKKAKQSHDSGCAEPDTQIEPVKSVRDNIQLKDGNAETIILAVVEPEHMKALENLKKEAKKHNELSLSYGPNLERQTLRLKMTGSKLVIMSPETLPNTIPSRENQSNSKYKTLYLLVGPTITSIYYNILDPIVRVFVQPCRDTSDREANQLRIDARSTFRGIKSYEWFHNPTNESGRGPRHELTHTDGCFIDVSEQIGNPESLYANLRLNASSNNGPLTIEEKAERENEFLEGCRDFMSEFGEEGRGPSANNGEANSWLGRWGGLLAMLLGGVAGSAGAFWCSSGGIFVKGPWGFYVAAGYFNLASVGGVVCAGGVASLAVGGLVYFIPWAKVFEWTASKLSHL